MPYILYSHDAWGTANVGEFATLEQAREVFNTLRSDRWYQADGSVRGLSIVESDGTPGAGLTLERTVESFSFPAAQA